MKTRVAVLWLSAALAVPAAGWQAAADPEMTKGIRHVDEGEFEVAIGTLNAVVQRLQARGGQPAELSRAYLYLAIAHLGLSQEQAAKAKFMDAVKTDQALSLSPYEFPPPIIKAFEQAKRELAAQARPPRPRISPAVMFEAVKQGDFPAVRQMLADDPALVGAKDERFGGTALHWAALKGHQAIVAVLLAEGADLKALNKDGETPLQVAQRAGKPEVVALLRPPGAFTASGGIFDAVKRGDLTSVREIVKGNPELVKLKDTGFGATPLHWAALKGHDAVVEFLLANGADAGATNHDGETPLQVAERSRRAGAVALLRRGGSGTSAPGIVEAIRAGDVTRVNQLLTEDPSRARTKDARFGATPLHWAALKGNEIIVDLLLANGADTRALNRDGETALQVAERARQTAVIPYLRAGGGSPSAGLVEAVKAGDVGRVQEFLQGNPSLLNQKDTTFGATPLHWAALRGQVEVLKLLLSRGADPKATNRDGETPLQVARRAGKTDVVAILSSR